MSDDLWCILKTSGGRTLPLMRSLVAAGYEAWTPKEMHKRRGGRGKPDVDREQAVTPGLVFVRAEHRFDLLRLLAQPMSPHPDFSIFRQAQGIPLIRDQSLAAMRRYEEKAARKEKRSHRYIYPRGTRVRIDEAAFLGLTGVVEESTDKRAVVSIGGKFPVTIETWLLHPLDVYAPDIDDRQDR